MSLHDVIVPSEVVNLGRANVRLRALSLKEIKGLFEAHAATVGRSWAKFGPDIQGLHPMSPQSQVAVFGMIGEAADLIADIIAVAADEPDCNQVAIRLPVEWQFRAAVAIFRLTICLSDIQAILQILQEALPAALQQAAATKH